MPQSLSRLDLYDIGRRYVLGRAKRINPREVDTEGSDINLYIGSTSYMASAVQMHSLDRINALLLDGVEDEDLDRYAWDRYQLLRKGASAAVTHTQITRPNVLAGAGSVPIGTKINSLDGIEYVTLSTAVFSPVTLAAEAKVRASQAGKEFQVGANQLRRFAKPSLLFDKSLQVNNAEPAAGGEPAEYNDVFRERIRDFWNAARRGTLGAIEYGARLVPGVESAMAQEVLAGGFPGRMVELFIADSSGVASRALASLVDQILSEYRAGGIFVRINTSRPVIEDIVLSLSFAAGVNTTMLTDQVRAAVIEYTNSLGVNQPLLVGDIYSVLTRFKQSGLIATKDSIVAPAGDVYPNAGTTIRTQQQNVITL